MSCPNSQNLILERSEAFFCSISGVSGLALRQSSVHHARVWDEDELEASTP